MAAVGASCIVVDPDYCTDDTQCPLVQTDMGMRHLLCNPSAHACIPIGGIQCYEDKQCTEPHSPRCDTATGTCTSCRVGDATDTSCQHFLDRPLCASSSDGSGTTQCVACVSHMDCPKESPICEPTSGQCRKCSAHTDCQGKLLCDDGQPCTDSLVCIEDESVHPSLVGLAGRCAQNGPDHNGRVIYVAPQESSCDPNADGILFSAPRCGMPKWTDPLALSHPYIRLAGNVDANANAISSGSFVVIGAPIPTHSYNAPANIRNRGASFYVNGTASLTVDEIHLSTANQGADTLVQCNGDGGSPANLKLRRSTLTGAAVNGQMASLAAVSIQNCNTVIEQNIIGVSDYTQIAIAPAHGTAVYLGDNLANGVTSYLIQNNIIAGNQGSAIYVSTQSNTNFVFRFNTIVGNGRANPSANTPLPPIVCPQFLPLKEFSHSIVMDNVTVQGMQIANPNGCGVRDVVVGSKAQDSNPAYTLLDAYLDKDFGFLTGMDNSCCIDKVTPQNGEMLPAADVHRTARPQGPAWDIGAVEKKQ